MAEGVSSDWAAQPPALVQEQVNLTAWRPGDHLSGYANRVLRPAEVIILSRYREALSA